MELFDKEFNKPDMVKPGEIREIVRFNSKAMKRILKQGYYIKGVDELWFDGDEGIEHMIWIDENVKGNWGMTQKDVDDTAKYAVRKFSHLTRRAKWKAIPRSFKHKHLDDSIMVYLFMRDKEGCDYAVFFEKKGRK